MSTAALSVPELRDHLDRTLGQLKPQRTNFEPVWEQIGKHFAPRRYRRRGRLRPGDRDDDLIINTTGVIASDRLRAALLAGASSEARPWFRFGSADWDLVDNWYARCFMEDAERATYKALARSNFYLAMADLYGDAPNFGIGLMIADVSNPRALRWVVCAPGTYWAASSDGVRVDTVYRELDMTVQQVVTVFGRDNCSPPVQALYDNGSLTAPIVVVHVIEPRPERDPQRKDSKHAPFRSVWYEAGSPRQYILREGGVGVCPIVAPRWACSSEDVYGWGPGWTALGDCKALQTLEERGLEAAEKSVRPPTAMAGGLKQSSVGQIAGEIVYMDAWTGNPVVQSLLPFVPRVEAQDVYAQRYEARVRQEYMNDLVLLLASRSTGQKTATEVNELANERVQVFGPNLERFQKEALKPAIDITYYFLDRFGGLPMPPKEMSGREIPIEFVSIFATVQRAYGAASLREYLALAMQIAEVDRQSLDKTNFDEMLSQLADMYGAPPKVLRPDDMVQQMRQQRDQQNRMAQMAQLAQPAAQAATAAQRLSQTDVTEPNALTRMMGMA